MNTQEINGHTYRFDRMDARKQFHVARKVGPLLAMMGNVAAAVGHLPTAAEAQAEKEQEAAGRFLLFMGPLAERLQEMSTADLDFVIDTCLSTAHRKEGDRWAPVMAGDGHTMMFADITMQTMLQITMGALRENLGNFFDLVGGAPG